MKTQDIRETFLDFFAQKNHKVVKSSSLLPQDDPTLLFTNAGMNQFKNVFLGLEKRSYKRAASVQKCMRVSGKHNDLETVGTTNKHHTFFEMLGNFSFGDYFKKEAILFAWELMTEVYKLKPDRMYATVYKEDDEAFAIWQHEIGLSSSKIFRLGKEDNYWSMGETGPCGPCSEIHYDLGPDFAAGDPETLIRDGSDRFVEIWNLVFMQFNQDAQGNIEPLPSPSVDTGMGLERLVAVLQNKISNFDTDVFVPLIDAIGNLIEKELPAEDAVMVPVRIIADHVRAVSFLIGDGIMPANDGRGYVLRRLVRRAYRAGNSLGVEQPFLFNLVGIVCDTMKDAYPELLTSADYIANVCLSEENRFASTLTSGMKVFLQYVEESRADDSHSIPGDKLFKLYDTFGFPLDLSKELATEAGLSIDESGFTQELENQRQRARQAWKGEDKQKQLKAYEQVKDLTSNFVGYETDRIVETSVLAILKDGIKVESLQAGDNAEVFLQDTPFYGEAGGQVGDTGVLKNPHFSALVETAYYPIPDLIAHKIGVLSGSLNVGDVLEAAIDSHRRLSIQKNHTATHLLHASLRHVLGEHVKQAGSLVSHEKFRFDFTHFASLSSAELNGIENLVNEKIQESIPVATQITSLEKGIEDGAIAIFEEKYKDQVRMVIIDEFSKELCGGVHAHTTGEIGLFKVISEGSIAAGMRRIEAITGEAAVRYVQENEDLLQELQAALNSPRKELLPQLDKLRNALKESERECRTLRQKLASTDFDDKEEQIFKIGEISLLIKTVAAMNMSDLRNLADSLKQKISPGVVILGTVGEDKVSLVAAVSKDLSQRLPANTIIQKIAPLIGGGGGGRADFAQAGGNQPEKLSSALEQSRKILEKLLEQS